ncbi:MAG TPA: CHRD domain-containing protein [Acidimicrobiia bacterium]
MRRLAFVAVLTAMVTLALAPAVAGKPADQRNFSAHLTGDNEIPATGSAGQGQVMFKLDRDGDSMGFKLIVANIEDVIMAHIHCGSSDVNGPVTVFLFGPSDPVDVDGILSQGTITPEDVIPIPDSAVCPGGISGFDDLLEKMRSGGAYVNVHTVLNPGGEIRGQLR